LAFFQKYTKARGVEEMPKITNLASKKPTGNPATNGVLQSDMKGMVVH